MLSAGLFVAICLLVTLAKLPWRFKLALTSYPVTTDVAVFTLLTLIHWGTFTGVMAATIGALTCSAIISIARWLVGYMREGAYVPGKLNVGDKLHAR